MITVTVTELVFTVCVVGALVGLAVLGFLLPGERVDADADEGSAPVPEPLQVLPRSDRFDGSWRIPDEWLRRQDSEDVDYWRIDRGEIQ